MQIKGMEEMKMKSIEPFNKVWLDCYNNLKLSLLISMNPKYETRGYENIYEYDCIEQNAGSGQIVNCITEEQFYIDYEEFAQMEKLNPDSEREFLEIVINQIKKKNGFVLMRTDLYDWLEGSVCWHNYHWDHYSLLVDYDEDNDMIIAFDEAGGQYKRLQVRRGDLYNHLSDNLNFEKIRLITVNDSPMLHPVSLQRLVNNAEKIVKSLEKCINKDFWYMQTSDYEDFWYKDLNGVYLQKIEGRQKANALLMEELSCIDIGVVNKLFDRWKSIFEDLSNEWVTIRMALFLIYRKRKNRTEKLAEINEKVQSCLLSEKKVWEEFISNMRKAVDLEINVIY